MQQLAQAQNQRFEPAILYGMIIRETSYLMGATRYIVGFLIEQKPRERQ
jgi:hypothetical protein